MTTARALERGGALLCLGYVLTFIRWVTVDDVPALLSSTAAPFAVCWPLLDGCAEHRPWPAWLTWSLLAWLLAGGLAGAALFLTGRARAGRAVLMVLVLVRALVQVQDLRLSGNFHHMPQLFAVAYLFWPRPEVFLRVLLVGFYFSAGTLKLNEEWLSAAALYAHPDWPLEVLRAGCVGVVVLECGLSWLLLASSARVFRVVFSLFVAFHVVSYEFVGWYYPAQMLCLLAFLPMLRAASDARALRFAEWPRSTWVGIATLALMQSVPAVLPGDSALTGEGRFTALSMFDARAVCSSRVIINGDTYREPLAEHRVWDVRIRCDPLVHRAFIRHLCSANPPPQLEYRLRSRRSRDNAFTTVMDVHDACAADLSYLPWRHQPWLLPGDADTRVEPIKAW